MGNVQVSGRWVSWGALVLGSGSPGPLEGLRAGPASWAPSSCGGDWVSSMAVEAPGGAVSYARGGGWATT
eukprot:6714739-Pyramimonas_sp.AAC.1